MIGETVYRGIGFAAEVIGTSARWLNQNWAIGEIVLDVNKSNQAVARACEKVGL